MAILKHKSSKNASYSSTQEYLTYKHKENPETGQYDPLLDEFGLLQERENYALAYIDGHGQRGDPDDWADACWKTNLRWHKNNQTEDVKQHQYIISHPEPDTPLLTMQDLMDEGIAFARENLPGYDTLVAVHMDRKHYHVHIVINSVRSVERQEEPWMTHDEDGQVLRCEISAGGKHQDTRNFRTHCQEWLLAYGKKKNWTLEDNLKVENERKQQRNTEIRERNARLILDTASHTASIMELQQKLRSEYNINLVLRGRTFTVFLPERKKGIRLETLGISRADILKEMGTSDALIRADEKAAAENIERKKYIVWLRERRLKNAIKADDIIADAAELIAGRVRASGKIYNKYEFRELHDLIKQTAYLEQDLRTELEKIDRLLDRWSLYLSSDLDETEKQSHKRYVVWCGCSPDSALEFQDLQKLREVVELQIKESEAVRTALLESDEDWKSSNDENRYQYQQQWKLSKEEALRHELKYIKENRKKLEQIAYNCQKAANRRKLNPELAEKAKHYRQLWHENLEEEHEIKRQLRAIRKENKTVSPSR